MNKSLRVVSLLPSATETLTVISKAAASLLVGRSHEDDYPKSITHLPILTGSRIQFTAAEVDKQVSSEIGSGRSLYNLDVEMLKSLKPDIVLTQDLCEVCAIDLVTVERVAKQMNPIPNIISLNPQSLDEVLNDILVVSRAIGMEEAGSKCWSDLTQRIQTAVGRADKFLASSQRKNVAFIEWSDPIFIGGHWTPQLIHMAGGSHPLNPTKNATSGAGKSFRITHEQLVASKPEVLIIAPCGLNLEETKRETALLQAMPVWQQLKKTVTQVALVDGNAFFNRPGPRLVDALEFLVGYLTNSVETIPETFTWEEIKSF
ncbi:hypothetical protein SmJEL517_g04655 [Synchytrium microbalum]|uniref:Fe/B12 periplasmic-binding domain-containing protein n=1 Tax=Synchytrium microbalum TaxID=1806994 RepID=A0A507BYM4_9FUNG|nr:uncharacterized protein SmJEL517_g04655 [Synchytrium microbalum]TPX32228.1 hypothetical protein SmJEL517_g04655 [Synchytrium microbalum]